MNKGYFFLFHLLILFILSLVLLQPGLAAQITIAWNASSGATGYKVYYGTTSRVYGSLIDAGDVTTYAFDLSPEQGYFIAVTAYNRFGESDYSHELNAVGLSTSINPPGAGTVYPSGVTWYNSGQSVSVSAMANSGYTFSSWSGDFSGPTNPSMVVMNEPKNVVGNFTQVNYTLTLSKAGNGSVKVNGTLQSFPWSGQFPSWRQVQLEAVPNSGWSFSIWSGDLTGSTNPTSITMNGNKNVAANFTPSCMYSISPTSQSFGPEASTGSVSVTACPGYSWTASTNPESWDWIGISSGWSGTGNGTVNYYLLANNSGKTRTGTLTIAGQTFTITQQPGGCFYSISPTSQSFGSEASMGSVSVTACPGYSWTASTNPESWDWIGISSGWSGTGNGTVNYYLLANNSGKTRTGTLTIAGQTFTITQSSAASAGLRVLYLSEQNIQNPTIIQILINHGFEIDQQSRIPEDFTSYVLLILSKYQALDKTVADRIKNFVQNGGGAVIMGDTPKLLAGNAQDLSSIRDWFGAGWYGNDSGYVTGAIPNPFETDLRVSDKIDFSSPSCNCGPAVYDLDSNATAISTWSLGGVHSFIFSFGQGRIFYYAGNPGLSKDPDPKIQENSLKLFEAGTLWVSNL